MSLEIEKNKPLQELNTLGVPALAQYFATVTNEQEVAEVFKLDSETFNILGGGSNVLFSDGVVPGVTVRVGVMGYDYTEQNTEGVRLTVGAGENFDSVVARSVADGYWGLENLSHIPGSVGATPVQNVGAYGVEVKDLIESVKVFDVVEKVFKTFSASDCQFAYRDSFFKKNIGKFLITEVVFKLSKKPNPKVAYKDLQKYFADIEPTLTDVREAIIDIRSQKFPDWTRLGTAGSYFKNPIIKTAEAEALQEKYPDLPTYDLEDGTSKLALGWILDKLLNLKGVQEGYVGTYKNQALVLVAYPGATAEMINNFGKKIIDLVYKETGVVVEEEVTKVGEWK